MIVLPHLATPLRTRNPKMWDESNLKRDISGEEKLIEVEITNLKTKVTKFKNTQQVLLKLYDLKL